MLNSFQELIVQTQGALTFSSPTPGAVDYQGICVPAHADSPLDPQLLLSVFPPNNYSLISFFHIDF